MSSRASFRHSRHRIVADIWDPRATAPGCGGRSTPAARPVRTSSVPGPMLFTPPIAAPRPAATGKGPKVMIFEPFLAAVTTLIEDFPAVGAVARPRAPAAAGRDPRPAPATRPELSRAAIRAELAALCAARNNCHGATGHDGAPGGGGAEPAEARPRGCVDCAKAHWTERGAASGRARKACSRLRPFPHRRVTSSTSAARTA
jgi:hypothetical protein